MTTSDVEFLISQATIDWSFIFRAAAAAAARVYVEGHDVHPQPGAIASRLSRLCHRDEIPEPTLDALIARGDGPRIFFIGRRRYALHADWDEWLTQLAATGGVGISGHRALQQDLVRAQEQLNHQKETMPPAANAKLDALPIRRPAGGPREPKRPASWGDTS